MKKKLISLFAPHALILFKSIKPFLCDAIGCSADAQALKGFIALIGKMRRRDELLEKELLLDGGKPRRRHRNRGGFPIGQKSGVVRGGKQGAHLLYTEIFKA